jgi:hypothetical protein
MVMRGEFPDFRDWGVAAVHLLQGVVEAEDGRAWDLVLSNRSQLEAYFCRIGLLLVIDESEGFAFLRQFLEAEMPDGYDALPKLFRSTRLGYGQTLVCVLLRDALRRFEEEEVHDERCVVNESDLLDLWKAFFPQQGDDVKQLRELQANLHKIEALGFVKKFGEEAGSWEVRRILKARLNADELEHLHRQLSTAAAVLERPDSNASPAGE